MSKGIPPSLKAVIPSLPVTDSAVSQTRARAPRIIELQDVVVTGIGPLLANCDCAEALWQQLSRGQCQLKVHPDPADGLPCAMGIIEHFEPDQYLDWLPARLYRNCHREQLVYLCSVVQALRHAGFEPEAVVGEPIGLYDGTSRGSFAFWLEVLEQRYTAEASRLTSRDIARGMPGQAVGHAAAALGVIGPTFTFNGTCASGAIAIGHALRELQTGRINCAVASGHDLALVGPVYEMYRAAGLLSHEQLVPELAIGPYSMHRGNAFGEGAVSLVLETRRHAEARGAQPLATISGFCHANGGTHPTDVDFVADRPLQVIQSVLDEACLGANDVDFVLGHGNGVRASDISELNYMKRAFGPRSREVPLISTKPVYGHTLGASSALNVAAAAMMLAQDFLVPTVGVDTASVVHGFNHQANGGEARELNAGLVMAYGIGGQNVALLLEKVNNAGR